MPYISIQIQVSNLRDIAGEGQVDVCDANNNTFHNFEVILQNKSIIIITSENVSMTIPTAPANGLVTLSIGNTPGTSKMNICVRAWSERLLVFLHASSRDVNLMSVA